MLILTRTMAYGTEQAIYLFNQYVLYGKEATKDSKLVLLEFKGRATDFQRLLEDNPADFDVERQPPRALYRYKGKPVRRPTLEDIMTVDVNLAWGLQGGDFTLEEYREFLERRFPDILERLSSIFKASGEDRIAPMKALTHLLERFQTVMYGVQTESNDEYEGIRRASELRLLDASKDLPWPELLRLASRMEDYEVQSRAAVMAFRRLFKEEEDPSKALWDLIRAGKKDPKLGAVLNLVYADGHLGLTVKHTLRFPQNVKGETIELQHLQEADMVTFGAHLADARFVGPIKIGRKFLWDAERNIYVAGSKKLKHHVMSRGGKVEKYGNTLVMKKADVDTDLLLIRKIDAYAVLNPAMVETIKNRKGRAFKVDKKFVSRIRKDWRVGRELADTALEELFGIDPSIARRLYRSRSKRKA